ncbi:MAG: hypothetical protein WCP95_13855 [Actinomycetes bacterium]
MTTRADFTDPEWTQVSAVPGLVLVAACLSDGHMMPSVRELSAGSEALAKGIDAYPGNAILQEWKTDSKQGADAAKDAAKPEEGEKVANVAQAVDSIVADLEPGLALLRAKATSEEFTQIGDVLSATAKAVVERLGDGFWGSGKEKVDATEQQFIDRLAGLLAG